MWLELESEYNLRPQSLCVFSAFLSFQIIPFNLANDVLSEGVVSSYAITLEALISSYIAVSITVHGVIDISGEALIIVFSN